MKYLLMILLVFAAIPACAWDFFFVQLADPQFGMTSGNKDMAYETAAFEKAVDHINRLKPAFVLISGDLVNRPHNPKQIREFWRIAHRIRPDVPLHLVPGNHDLEGRPTPESIRSYEKLFGKDHYAFSHAGTEFLVLDSCLIADPTGAPDFAAAQRRWFEEQLAAARSREPDHIVVCTHHPWFMKAADEKDDYFNIPIERRAQYLGLMKRYGVELALAGHWHRESIGSDGPLKMITTSALGKPLGPQPSGLRIVRVYKDRIESDYYGLDQVPQRIGLTNRKAGTR